MDEIFVDYSEDSINNFTNFPSSDNCDESDIVLKDQSSSKAQADVLEKEEECLDFSQLPLDLQCNVINKFEFQEFARFEVTSRLANFACEQESHLIPVALASMYVNKKTVKLYMTYDYHQQSITPRIPYHSICQSPVKIRVDTINIRERITSGRMRKVAKMFEEHKTTAEEIRIEAHVAFEPEDLDYLLKVTAPHYFMCSQFLPRKFVQTKVFQNLNYINLGSTGCTDEELLKLNGNDLISFCSDFITPHGVNKFLKQWMRKERDIRFVCLQFGTTHRPQNFDAILEGLDANPVWTPEFHFDSILGALPLQSIYPMRTTDPEHIYSIWRPENPDERIMIKLSREVFRANIMENEAQIILDWLNADEYYTLFKKCRDCQTQFCEHRRKYSTARLRKFHPKWHNFIVNGIAVLGVATSVTRLLDYIYGERPFTRIPQHWLGNLELQTGPSECVSTLQMNFLLIMEERFEENSQNSEDRVANSSSGEDTYVFDISDEEEESVEEEHPFDFSQLPLELQCNIINKFEFQEFKRFEEASRLANFACGLENHLIPFNLPAMYVHKRTIKIRMAYQYDLESIMPKISYGTVCQSPVIIHADTVTFPDRITSRRLRKVAKLFEEDKTTADEIRIMEPVVFKPEDLDYFFKVTSPHYLFCSQFMSRSFFTIQGMQKIEHLSLGETGCTDEELVKLNGENFLFLKSDFITARGVNTLLKQWKRREREINYLSLQFGTHHGPQNYDTLLEGLDANPVWTPATHYDSILSGLPLESVYPMRNGDREHIYSIWRPDDLDQRMLIRLNRDMFWVYIMQNETSFILQWLSDDEHYILFNECRDCRMQFCEHRKRYSMPRLKKYYPSLYCFISSGIQGLRVVSTAARLLKYLSGDRPFTRVLPYGYEDPHLETFLFRCFSTVQFYLFDYI